MAWKKRRVERERQKELKERYGELFQALSELLFLCDPMGLNLGFNIEEYEPEAGSILARLPRCRGVDDVLNAVHEEFCRWFGVEAAGLRESYLSIAERIWLIWRDRGRDASS